MSQQNQLSNYQTFHNQERKENIIKKARLLVFCQVGRQQEHHKRNCVHDASHENIYESNPIKLDRLRREKINESTWSKVLCCPSELGYKYSEARGDTKCKILLQGAAKDPKFQH